MRFGIEAAFLLMVAAGAALSKLSPAQIILLMFFAWALVVLIERARARTRPVAWQMASEDEPEPAERRWSWRRRRQESEPPPQEDEAAARPEAELEPAVEPETIEAADETPSPAVTKRTLDLPGLEEPEPEVPPAPEPELPPAPEPELPPAPQPDPVAVDEAPPPAPPPAPREWNLWELERQALEHAGDSARREEWTALFVYLRQFATTEGLLPTEFDGLVRESFGELIQAA